MSSSSSSPAPAPAYRKLDAHEQVERDRKILQWHYVHSWPARVIHLMLVKEADEIRARGGIPDKPLTIKGIFFVIEQQLRKDATFNDLDARGAVIRAKMRYEHLFQICLGILKRQPKAATYTTGGKRLTREIPPLKAGEAVALVRAAASVQSMLDRVSGIKDPRELLEFLGEQDEADAMNPLAICQQLVKLFPGQNETQERIRGIFTDVVRGRVKVTDGPLPGAARGKRRRSPRRG